MNGSQVRDYIIAFSGAGDIVFPSSLALGCFYKPREDIDKFVLPSTTCLGYSKTSPRKRYSAVGAVLPQDDCL